MNENETGPMAREDFLARITEGMEVYDSAGEHIGKVDAIYLGAMEDSPAAGVSPVTVGAVPADTADMDVNVFAGLFHTTTNIPDEIRERLRYQGFIRIAPHGLFRTHRYALRDQVTSVAGDRVTVSAQESKLLKG